MPVWSQSSALPLADATSDRVSDHDSDTHAAAAGSRWGDLYRLLLVPGTEGYALRAIPDGAPIREASGDPVELITRAEQAGAGQAVWAIVAPVRPDLVVVDLDHCADRALAPILDTVDDAAAQVAYIAESGSPDSVHVAVACPTQASRQYLIERITTIRSWECLSHTELDLRTAQQFLRLPGSAPLKPGGGWCYPIDDRGTRMTATAATMRADRAVRELPRLLTPVSARDDETRQRGRGVPQPRTPALAVPSRAPRWDADLDDAADDEWTTGSEYEQPRAWRPQRRFTTQEWAILHHTPTQGYRSHAATAAAWVLWQYGVRGWQRAAGWYRSCPAFAKFRERDDGGRGHWESIKARAASYRPAGTADDLVRTVLTEIAAWDDPALVAAAYAAITHRFGDGYGTDHRPIAWRDMALWLNVSHATAGRRIRGLIERGLLCVSRPHDRASAPREATCYSLRTPHAVYRTDLHHDLTEGGAQASILHPVWGVLGHSAWATWHRLSPTTGTSTQTLSALTGLRPGTLTHGTRNTLATLAKHGLAAREGRGRATRWVRGPRTLTAAADACGATAQRSDLAKLIVGEREAWHSSSVRRSFAAREQLRRGRRRRCSSTSSELTRPRATSTRREQARSTLPLPLGPLIPVVRRYRGTRHGGSAGVRSRRGGDGEGH